MKSKEQIEQQIENLLVAQALMEDIPKKKLSKWLASWRELGNSWDVSTRKLLDDDCGSAACFGGWVAVTPYFRRQGVKTFWGGGPKMGSLSPNEISFELFGERFMFDSSYSNIKNEKTVVKQRIKKALSNRLKELGHE